jgi:hypothetical protein
MNLNKVGGAALAFLMVRVRLEHILSEDQQQQLQHQAAFQ